MLELIEPQDVGGEPFRSHPFEAERIRNVVKEIRVDDGETLRIGAEDYDEAIAALLAVAAQTELDAGSLDRAKVSITRHLTLKPGSGRGYYVKAEQAP